MATAKSELLEINKLGATPVHNSGRGLVKGDGILYVDPENKESGYFTVDVKEYPKSYGVSLTTWRKIQTDAHKNKTEPMLKIVLGSEEENNRIRVIAIPEHVFKDMWEVYKNAQ